eukprot:CAMPEP_0198291948 /NCGR_PEP_ID=MMETSP1449-20131203/9280_1 /TAXON_ID=420275 /ORGANISM="Attheya septentrionalis, Strain CCMP2084" /LENGTH=351 /DNA_ID=CAMNT_0043990635 /DNA_START=367 /DNA_END=1422 /DNA_ORIENTATION=+
MLSSPMAIKNQELKRIAFDDVEVEVWDKAMAYLEPGGFGYPTFDDILKILPVYDEYQFPDGIRMCDSVIAKLLALDETIHIGNCHDPERYTPLVKMTYVLNLPQSKHLAVKWAADSLQSFVDDHTEETIRDLLPLVENEEEVLLTLVKTVKGRHCRGMTVDEMRNYAKKQSFPQECIMRSNQIKEVNAVLKQMSVARIYTNFVFESTGGIPLSGEFETRCRDQGYGTKSHMNEVGAMRNVWVLKRGGSYNNDDDDSRIIILEAMDAFGNVWEIYAIPIQASDEEGDADDGHVADDDNDDDDGGGEQRQVLFRWDGGYSSLFPPKVGWNSIEGESPAPSFTYTFDNPSKNYR